MSTHSSHFGKIRAMVQEMSCSRQYKELVTVWNNLISLILFFDSEAPIPTTINVGAMSMASFSYHITAECDLT